jgi:plastocyanin
MLFADRDTGVHPPALTGGRAAALTGGRAAAPHGVVLSVVLALLVAVGLTGCGGSSASQQPAVTTTASPTVVDGYQVFRIVGLRNLQFSAATLVAKPGRIRVEFSVEAQSAPHNFVVPLIPAARTDILTAGRSQTITFTADKPGDYPVICTLHPNMTATLKIA